MTNVIEETLRAIPPLDHKAELAARNRLDNLTKPLGSLGRLEEIVCRYAAIRGEPLPRADKRTIVVFVADHGVAEEGVSAYPQAVTGEMLKNFARGGAAINVLARRLKIELKVVDVGVATDGPVANLPEVSHRRIANGTGNFLRGPAMTVEQACSAVEVGIEIARCEAAAGTGVFGTGEMGIGNTTSAAALCAALTGIPARQLVGRGTGLDDAGVARKASVVERALATHRASLASPIDVLAALGGFEIGAIAGLCLGASAARTMVVVDGFIATAAALLACKLHEGAKNYMLFAHRSQEAGHELVLKHLGVRPLLELEMRLGEGTGAAIAIGMVDLALALFHEMATFADAGVSRKLETPK